MSLKFRQLFWSFPFLLDFFFLFHINFFRDCTTINQKPNLLSLFFLILSFENYLIEFKRLHYVDYAAILSKSWKDLELVGNEIV